MQELELSLVTLKALQEVKDSALLFTEINATSDRTNKQIWLVWLHCKSCMMIVKSTEATTTTTNCAHKHEQASKYHNWKWAQKKFALMSDDISRIIDR